MRNLIRNVHNSFDQKWGTILAAMPWLIFYSSSMVFCSVQLLIPFVTAASSRAFKPRKFVVKNGKSCEAFGTNTESYLYLVSTVIWSNLLR